MVSDLFFYAIFYQVDIQHIWLNVLYNIYWAQSNQVVDAP